VIDRWQRKIKDAAAELLTVEGKIGELNRRLRGLKASKAPVKSLAQIPDGIVVPSKFAPPHNGARAREEDLFLSCFFTIAKETLDPRQLEAISRDARALARDHQRMHSEEERHA
jgi:hypothetical protein